MKQHTAEFVNSATPGGTWLFKGRLTLHKLNDPF
jgi:hypothetical protein